MLHRIPRVAKVAILTAAVLLAAPAASLLQTPHHASSALDNPLTGVTYACSRSVCKILFPSGQVICNPNGDNSDCYIVGPTCYENPCD